MRSVPGVLWIAAGAALWGTDTVLRRPLVQAFTPIQLVFYEHLILAVAVLPILITHRHYFPKMTIKAWSAVAVISWVGSAIATVLFTYSIRSGSPTTAVLLQKTQPLFAIGLARGLLGEGWHRRFPVVVLAALAGAYLISFGDRNLLAPWQSLEVTASILAIAAAAGWGSSTVFGRFLTSELPFELVTALRVVCALPLLLVLSLRQGIAQPAANQFTALAALALIPGFAALMLYYRGLRTTTASHASIAELAFPATAAVLNWTVLGVPAHPMQIAGFAVVWSAIFYLSRDQKISFNAN